MHVTHAYTYPYIGSHHSKVHLILKIHLFTFDIVDDWRDQWFHLIYQHHEDHGSFLKRKWRITEQFLAMVPSPRRKKPNVQSNAESEAANGMHLIQPFAIQRLLRRVLFLLFFKTICT